MSHHARAKRQRLWGVGSSVREGDGMAGFKYAPMAHITRDKECAGGQRFRTICVFGALELAL